MSADLRAVLADFHHQGGDAQRAGDALTAVLGLADEPHESPNYRGDLYDQGWQAGADRLADDIRAAIAGALGIEEGNHG